MSECNSFAWDSFLEAGAGPSASASASTSKKSKLWPPGIRFHPTDEELIMYHLKRKVCRRRMERNVIGDVDVYKCEPWELPGKSLLQTGDKQWFFFSPRDRKYANGVRSNRGTKCGYWKATGKDRSISRNSRTVGMKKTLVFHTGRAPRGERTDWVMHEYTMVKEELKNYDTVQDSYALYKIFQKSGPGPKNGEQYGAPFREDEWSDDDAFDTGFTIPTSIENVLPPAEPTNGFDQCLSLGSTLPTSRENVLPPAEPPNGFDQCLSLGSTIPTGRENVLPPAVPTNGSDQCLSLDILEEFPLEIADNPDLSEQHVGCSFVPKVDGEEGTQNFAVMPLPGEPPGAETSKVWQPCEHADDLQTRIQNTQPANTFLQPPEERCLTDGDFMELNDLLDLKPSVSNLDSRSDEHPFLNKNGAYDWDLYFDAPMFLPEEIVPLEGTSLQPFFGGFSDDVVRQLDYDDENHYVAAQVTSQLWTHEQTINVVSPTGSNRVVLPPSAPGIICDGSLANIHEGTLKEGGSRSDPLDPCFISAIHSLLESVPSNPASASENNLISRALERMSSFGAARIGASSSGIAVDGASPRRRDGRNDGFLFVSCLGALWALMWVLMIGTVVKVFKALFGKFIAS